MPGAVERKLVFCFVTGVTLEVSTVTVDSGAEAEAVTNDGS
jgi:hypothetical protein